MQETQFTKLLAAKAQAALRRGIWVAEGKMEAFRFVLTTNGDLQAVEAKIQESNELILDPGMAAGPMAPGAGPRIFREGYVAGLKEALAIIEQNDQDV